MKRSPLRSGSKSVLRGASFRSFGVGVGNAPGDRARSNGVGVPRRPVSPASAAQRLKAAEGCRVHGHACGNADPAHAIPRAMGGCDHEDCIVPLCRATHRAYDDGRFDLLPHMSLAEQAHAAGHLGLLRALRRITGCRWVPVEGIANE